MKIQMNPILPGNDTNTIIHEGSGLLKGSAFSGRIVSIDANIAVIRTEDGSILKAQMDGNMDLPMNTMTVFKVAESTGDLVIIKPLNTAVRESAGNYAAREGVLAALLEGLGMEPSAENMGLLRDGGFMLGRNIEKLMMALSNDGRQSEAQNLRDVMIRPGELLQYIKEFDGGERFFSILENILKSSGANSSKLYGQLCSNIIKGLAVQINNSLPIFYIPVPMYIENRPYHGEVWIEKDDEGHGAGRERIYLHVLMNTPSFGRMEADIIYSENSIGVDIFCNKDTVSLFGRFSGSLEASIKGLGVSLTALNVHELKKARNFIDFAGKYIKPYASVDVKA